ncbi:MAG: hypothetical protein A2945_00055 [Candidatus Liptonbacteria bacterium RIFCSPLOWO2_01_FULL_52_25]|uniref:Addiction module toxin RelE n=1 Tax=Candidatus Liptonbacteria bacterium RIFCSPLOWO2_01_FULL_52_25 TaxID=1798650 RepID=A0A1G2CD23_9BACT|nr:MAG: hypothetical protein A2945_00055 [Candidatus Liptonbacteria bacterium RIFCSPLOWO2_01_FULL_52_25]
MNLRYTELFRQNFSSLPKVIKDKYRKQEKFLLISVRYPSLRAKKYDESGDVWQARVDDHYRFYFQIESDTYVIVNILPHSD